MEEFFAKRIAQRSGFVGYVHLGNTVIESYSWRRGQDRGKRRLTYGIYGTKNQLSNALAMDTVNTNTLRWNEFRNGKFMVW